ncbi:DUF1659 domain-containing protein [Alkalicoccus chagannorensis]|uniref:DUF1659 domain-containing protein n=1 Tax=Alkalicoccus chagannorensis TaxID=427072 RepID=UPI000417015C|nr:DUF1659 domain-containing protein [Alkalicoccus chagannorensis]
MNNILTTRLVLTFSAGTDEDGGMITRTRSFSNVDMESQEAQLNVVAEGLVSLQSLPLHAAEVNRTYALNSEWEVV